MKNLSVILLTLLCFSIILYAQESVKTVIVEVKQGDTLRTIAEKYMGDADSWPEIMRINDLKSPEEVKVGDEIRIVSNSGVLARKAIWDAQESISKAVDAGASIYAAKPLKEAKDLFVEAQKALRENRIFSVRLLALPAKQKADFAYSMCNEIGLKDIQATLSDLKGEVQTKKEEEMVWDDAHASMKLFTGHKIRTFSKSRADVSFVNGDLMRIGEKSLTVIKELKMDTRRRSNKSSVIVLEGDIAAQLQNLKSGDEFQMETKSGVEMDVRAKDFYVDVEEESEVTRVAVYDKEGEIDVSSAGSSITLGANQGTKIRPNAAPEPAHDLLLPPALLTPDDKTRFSRTKVSFSWKPVDGAVNYILQVAKDPNFTFLVLSEDNIQNTKFSAFLEDGRYYWRVKSVDEELFPGSFSPFYTFMIAMDRVPPAIQVKSPKEDEVLLATTFDVEGITEPDVTLTINGESVQVDEKGKFVHNVTLKNNNTQVTLTAVDSVGNKSAITRLIRLSTYSPQIIIDNISDMQHTNQMNFPISGQAKNSSSVTVNSKKIALTSENKFNTNIRLTEGKNSISIIASDNFGRQDEKNFKIVLDTALPQINLQKSIRKSVTQENEIRFWGQVDACSTFTINSMLVNLSGESFNETFILAEGDNNFIFKSEDKAGNTVTLTESIKKDSQPPVLLSQSITPNPVITETTIELSITAKDEGVGARKVLKYGIKSENDFYYEGILEKSRNSDVYSGEINLPQNIKGMLYYDYILLEDYLDNIKKYEF